ncbi:hypothetical protein E4U56_003748 [Claviceps arundinis]|uniref:5'-3' DNA helicase ZGRF1-like N-terminal domain-containing protein n=1 Tax=Claviceps arundinis TaxID=1623583 RepID=A0A9P7MMK8_9HYPO|nr:hypothetical protein E4U56_003748 [Claviceps arundinis]
MSHAVRRIPSAAPATTRDAHPTTATVLDYNCLFTHDLKRKQKRWQDGKLKYHSYNKKIMVYDDRGNFIGDAHWQADGALAEDEELQLDRGSAIVQVADYVGSREQDLTEVLDKRVREVEKRRAVAAARTPASGRAAPAAAAAAAAAAAVESTHFQLMHRPLSSIVSSPGPLGRASISTRSPFEVRKVDRLAAPPHQAPISARKRRRSPSPPSKAGFARSLFGAALSLSGSTCGLVNRRPGVLKEREVNVQDVRSGEISDEDVVEERPRVRSLLQQSRHLQEKAFTKPQERPRKEAEGPDTTSEFQDTCGPPTSGVRRNRDISPTQLESRPALVKNKSKKAQIAKEDVVEQRNARKSEAARIAKKTPLSKRTTESRFLNGARRALQEEEEEEEERPTPKVSDKGGSNEYSRLTTTAHQKRQRDTTEDPAASERPVSVATKPKERRAELRIRPRQRRGLLMVSERRQAQEAQAQQAQKPSASTAPNEQSMTAASTAAARNASPDWRVTHLDGINLEATPESESLFVRGSDLSSAPSERNMDVASGNTARDDSSYRSNTTFLGGFTLESAPDVAPQNTRESTFALEPDLGGDPFGTSPVLSEQNMDAAGTGAARTVSPDRSDTTFLGGFTLETTPDAAPPNTWEYMFALDSDPAGDPFGIDPAPSKQSINAGGTNAPQNASPGQKDTTDLGGFTLEATPEAAPQNTRESISALQSEVEGDPSGIDLTPTAFDQEESTHVASVSDLVPESPVARHKRSQSPKGPDQLSDASDVVENLRQQREHCIDNLLADVVAESQKLSDLLETDNGKGKSQALLDSDMISTASAGKQSKEAIISSGQEKIAVVSNAIGDEAPQQVDHEQLETPSIPGAQTSKHRVEVEAPPANVPTDGESEEFAPATKRRPRKRAKPPLSSEEMPARRAPPRRRSAKMKTDPQADAAVEASEESDHSPKKRRLTVKKNARSKADITKDEDTEEDAASDCAPRKRLKRRQSKTESELTVSQQAAKLAEPSIKKLPRKGIKSKEIFGFVPPPETGGTAPSAFSIATLSRIGVIGRPPTALNRPPGISLTIKPGRQSQLGSASGCDKQSADQIDQPSEGQTLISEAQPGDNIAAEGIPDGGDDTAMAAQPVPNQPASCVPPSEKDTARAKIANPATRGKKAARKTDAAGQAPQYVVPFEPPQPVQPVPKAKLPEPNGALPGFSTAKGGAWSAHAEDLLGMTRPTGKRK